MYQTRKEIFKKAFIIVDELLKGQSLKKPTCFHHSVCIRACRQSHYRKGFLLHTSLFPRVPDTICIYTVLHRAARHLLCVTVSSVLGGFSFGTEGDARCVFIIQCCVNDQWKKHSIRSGGTEHSECANC